jgi:hypothetical protein
MAEPHRWRLRVADSGRPAARPGQGWFSAIGPGGREIRATGCVGWQRRWLSALRAGESEYMFVTSRRAGIMLVSWKQLAECKKG